MNLQSKTNKIKIRSKPHEKTNDLFTGYLFIFFITHVLRFVCGLGLENIWRSMMRKRITFLLTIILFLLFFQSCRSWYIASKPDVQDYPKDLSKIEIKFQYRIDTCRYYQQYSKVDLQCITLQIESAKVLKLFEYHNLVKLKVLPDLFNAQGKYKMSFDDFYKYVK